jgi:hypothetical protein
MAVVETTGLMGDELLKASLAVFEIDIKDIPDKTFKKYSKKNKELIEEFLGESGKTTWTKEEKEDIKKLKAEMEEWGEKYLQNSVMVKHSKNGEIHEEKRDIRNNPEVLNFFKRSIITSYIIKKIIEELGRGIYYTIPSNSITKTAKLILNNPMSVKSIRRGQIKQTDLLNKNAIITYKGNDSVLNFELAKITRRVKNGAKIFNFFLQKLNEQHRQEITTFQLDELVSNGLYANKDSAYRGLKKVTDKMMSISIEGSITLNVDGKRKEVRNAKAVLIAQRDITYNKCCVSLPPILRGATYITLLPSWSYNLSENSFMLLDYIFYLARQSTRKIKEEGHFNISLEAIRLHLGLPSPRETQRHKQFISDPIEEAITEIEDSRKGTDIKITPFYNLDYKNINEYLNGYLQIELDQVAQKYMEERALKQEEEYKKEQKRIEKASKKES